MKKRYLIPLVLAAALKFGGCQELPGDQNLRRTLVEICIEKGCCPQDINEKVTPKVEQFTTDMRAYRLARGLSRYMMYGHAFRREHFHPDRNRVRARIVQDFKDMHE